MALVKRERTKEPIGERHGMNDAGEGGRTCIEVTIVMENPYIIRGGREEHNRSVNGALVRVKAA
jgi:hypothetical protein